MPSVGQAGAGAKEAPSGVTEQTMAVETPPPMLEWMELPHVLVAPSIVGAAPQVKAPSSWVEMAMTVTSQAQLDAAVVVPEEEA